MSVEKYNFIKNNITLEKIKKVLCPGKTNKDFVNLIFDVLKENGDYTFVDSFGEKHLSSFMKGNHDGKKRLNLRRLKRWSEYICFENHFDEMSDSVEVFVNSFPDENKHNTYNLIVLYNEMPEKLVQRIKLYKDENAHGRAILLLILWAVYGNEQMNLLRTLYVKKSKDYFIQQRKKPVLLSNPKPCRHVFMGRENELSEIAEHFSSGHNFLFLQGMGGIGKSECAKQYAKQYKKRYDVIVFAEYSDSIVSLVNDNTLFTLTEPFVSERLINNRGIIENAHDFFKRKLTQIRLSSDKRTLIIIDNVDQYDSKLEKLLSGPFDLIVTTRWKYDNLYPDNTVFINEIQNKEILRAIYYNYYGSEINDIEAIDCIIDIFQHHTMAIELAAKQMKASCLSAAEMLERINAGYSGGTSYHELSERFLMLNYSDKPQNMLNYIYKLFDMAALTKTEKYILMCLTLIPSSGINKRLFKNCVNLKDFDEINCLIECSWICEANGKLSLHALVREAVQKMCMPDLKKCHGFIKGFMSEISDIQYYHSEYSYKNEMEKTVLYLYRKFPEPQKELYDFYEWMELIFEHCCCYNEGKELAVRLWEIYSEEYGDKSFRTARMLCRQGCGLIRLFDTKKGIGFLEEGKAVIESLRDKSVKEEIYISDIGYVLSIQYLEQYEKYKFNDMLDKAEILSREVIDIRKKYNALENENLRLLCVVPYCNLAYIEILKNDQHKALEYLQKAWTEHCKDKAPLMNYYLYYVQSKYEKSRNDFDASVKYLCMAIEYIEKYLSKTSMLYIKRTFELGKLYEETANYEKAYAEYVKVYDILKNISFFDSVIYSEVEKKLEKLHTEK